MNRSFLRRLYALCKKESLQIVRDPSTLLIAFLFPVVLLFVFGAGINLDSSVIDLGIVAQDTSARAKLCAFTELRFDRRPFGVGNERSTARRENSGIYRHRPEFFA